VLLLSCWFSGPQPGRRFTRHLDEGLFLVLFASCVNWLGAEGIPTPLIWHPGTLSATSHTATGSIKLESSTKLEALALEELPTAKRGRPELAPQVSQVATVLDYEPTRKK
jgi:hypothetical protein